jgi:uncharacterized repeat protein (TIGR01451 family)
MQSFLKHFRTTQKSVPESLKTGQKGRSYYARFCYFGQPSALGGLLLAGFITTMGVEVFPTIVQAAEIPTTATGTWGGTGTTATATKKMPSGLQVNVSVTGAGMSFGARTNTALMMSNNTTVPLLPSATNGIQVLITSQASCDATSGTLFCPGLGSLNFSFTDPSGQAVKVQNPVLHLSRMGGFVTQTGGTTIGYTLASILDLTTPGITLGTAPASNSGFYINNSNQLSPKNTAAGNFLPGFRSSTASSPFAGQCGLNAGVPQAGCGTVPIIGTTSSLGFNLSMQRAFISADTSLPWAGAKTGADGIFFTFSVDEDYGDAPATYDASNAASHVISDLKLGQTITADNTTTINGGATGTPLVGSSPKAVAAGANNNASNGDGASDDGVSSFPVFTTTSVGSYTVPVSLTGASRAGQVCGWVDFNRNNTFDNLSERACTSFASGATSVNLNWTLPAIPTAGNTYARIRASYDTTSAGAQNPTGPLSSGEVEDYQLTIGSPPVIGAPSNPFTCDSSIYLSQATSTSAASLSKITPTSAASNPYGLIFIGSAGVAYNGIAYRTQDNFVYATPNPVQSTASLTFPIYRIDSTGTATFVTNISFASGASGYTKAIMAGTFDSNGSYYIPISYALGGVPTNSLIRIDFSGSMPIARTENFTGQNLVFNQDIAFNPLDNSIYGYTGAGTPILYKINPATGVATPVISGGGSSGVIGSFDSLVIDANGKAYATLATGGIYSVNLSTGAATKIGNTTLSGGIDGTNCPLATISLKPDISGYKSVKITTDFGVVGSADPNDVLTYSVTYVNTGTAFANNFQVSDILPANVTLNGTPTVSFTGTGTAATINTSYNGTSNTNLLGAGAVVANSDIGGTGVIGSITVSIPVKINVGYQGDLYNQASATSNEIASPIKTDNLDNATTGLPFTVPSGSLAQTQTAALDKTYVQVTNLKVNISGKVWNDLDGNGSINGSETGTDTNTNGASNNLYAVLTDDLGVVLQVVAVDDATGNYNFTGVSPNQAVKVLLSTTQPTIGSDFTLSVLPSDWVGTAPGDSVLSFTTSLVNITGKDLGIEQPPTAIGQAAATQFNPNGTVSVNVPSSLFTSSTDPSSTVAAYKISDFPANVTSITINGNLYTALDFPDGGVMITATELATPGNLQIDPVDGLATVSIPFQAIDFAGRLSSNIDFATLPFTIAPAKVLFVKRITAINGTAINFYEDDTTSIHQTDDNHPGWPTPPNADPAKGAAISSFLKGKINAGIVKPGDTIEYTVYFLNAGGYNATNVKLCDRITGEQQFQSVSGITLRQEDTLSTPLTSIADADRGTFFATSSSTATGCNFKATPATDNGAVAVDITGASGPAWATLKGSTGPGSSLSFGYVRFITKVDP